MISRRIPDPNVWIIYAAILLLGNAYGMSLAVLPLHLSAHGIPEIVMGGLASAFAFGIAALALPAGYFVRRFGAKPVLLSALVGYAVSVSVFPSLQTTGAITVARLFDGAFSAAVWVSAETALLSRSNRSNKAYVMSLYAISVALGYVFGPLLSMAVTHFAAMRVAFLCAGVLACLAAAVVFFGFTPGSHVEETAAPGEGLPRRTVLWRIKTSCFGTFAYGYFQASVVSFLPLYLIKVKGVPESRTFLTTAFFALGMLASSAFVGRIADRHGHLRTMRVLATVGCAMVASFVLLPSFTVMLVAVTIAGATLAAISPVSLALQGVVVEPCDLGRANAYYNVFYAAGMLFGPSISGLLFTSFGGGVMLAHIAALWAGFVAFTVVFASDDPRSSTIAPERRATGLPPPVPRSQAAD